MKTLRKISLFLLSLVMVLSSALLFACNEQEIKINEIKIKEGTFKTVYTVGEVINYSDVIIVATKSDESTEEFKLDSKKVTSYTRIDTATAGEKDFEVVVGEAKVKLTVQVNAPIVELESIAFAENTIKSYTEGDEIDYSTITLVLTYSDNSTSTVKLTDATYTPIDTSVVGKQTLTATYQEKSAEIQIEIMAKPKMPIVSYSLPQTYIDYLNASKVKNEADIGEEEFFVKGEKYVVGTQNKFEFVPVAYDEDLEDVDNLKTTCKLYVLNGAVYELEEDYSTYMSVEENMYSFTDDSIDKTFRLEISLDEEIYDTSDLISKEVVIEFIVKKAYNVYDTYGLSVMDNLNVENWKEIKKQQLKWDDKPLSEYINQVDLVVLHNDVVINPDQLPSNYFWNEDLVTYEAALSAAKTADSNWVGEGKLGYADKLLGSLRDGVAEGESEESYTHGNNYPNDLIANTYKDGTVIIESWENENMQKGIFNTDRCSISGNYMTLSTTNSQTRHLTTVVSSAYGDSKKQAPVSHWAVFKFIKTSENVEDRLDVSIENIFMLGNMGKGTKSEVPAGLMGINVLCDSVTINNVKTSQFYTHMAVDSDTRHEGAVCTLNFNNSRMTDAYSNMFYLWRSKVNVTNSIMKNAGGPLFILTDSDREVSEGVPANGDNDGPVLNVDGKSILESYATGQESWYRMYNAQALFTQLNGMSTLMKANQGINKAFFHKRSVVGSTEPQEMANVIAVIIPNPGSIMATPNEPINIYGKIVRTRETGEVENYAMNEDAIMQIAKGIGTVLFNSANQYAFMPSMTEIALGAGLKMIPGLSQMIPGLSEMDIPCDFTKSSDWLTITLSAAALGFPEAPYFSVLIGDFK